MESTFEYNCLEGEIVLINLILVMNVNDLILAMDVNDFRETYYVPR